MGGYPHMYSPLLHTNEGKHTAMTTHTYATLNRETEQPLASCVVTETLEAECLALCGHDLAAFLPTQELTVDVPYDALLAHLETVRSTLAAPGAVRYTPPVEKEAHGSIPEEDRALPHTIIFASSDDQGNALYRYRVRLPIAEDATRKQNTLSQLVALITMLEEGKAQNALLRRTEDATTGEQPSSVEQQQ